MPMVFSTFLTLPWMTSTIGGRPRRAPPAPLGAAWDRFLRRRKAVKSCTDVQSRSLLDHLLRRPGNGPTPAVRHDHEDHEQPARGLRHHDLLWSPKLCTGPKGKPCRVAVWRYE